MYCNTKQMLLDARKNGYAIGAFNISNMEFAQAVINAAKETNTPVMAIQLSSGKIITGRTKELMTNACACVLNFTTLKTEINGVEK